MNLFAKNIGNTERLARIGAGLALLKLGKKSESKLGKVGLLPLVTGLCGRCPAYSVLGINTAGKSGAKSGDCAHGCGCHSKHSKKTDNTEAADDKAAEQG